MVSAGSKVTRFPRTSRPSHMLFPLPRTSSSLVCLLNSYSHFKTQFGYVLPLGSRVSRSFSMSLPLGSECSQPPTFFLPGHLPPLSSLIPGRSLCHGSHHVLFVRNSRKTVSDLRWYPIFTLPPPHSSHRTRTQQKVANVRGPRGSHVHPGQPSHAWMRPPRQLIQNVLNSSQERILAVCELATGSPILLVEIQDLVFWCPPRTISIMPAVSWGPGDKATRASLWARTATSKLVRCCGRCTYWNSYLLGVEIWTLSGQREGERALWGQLENRGPCLTVAGPAAAGSLAAGLMTPLPIAQQR